ncbi:MAG: type II toxin-antitoxin system ParD family antitoxin [Okeania sp. SIO2H7]|nr:type II toxin-antitoxin system ParD family antitoxin [Okeania sp. SIO2H7]
MTISLSPELEKLITDKVESGKYASASEVIRVSLQLLDEREKREAERMAQLKELIREGIEAADRGELIDGEAVFKELRERNRQHREEKLIDE